MKTTLFTTRKYSLVIVALLFAFLVSTTMAQNFKVSDLCSQKYAKQNLIVAIHSSNLGVRESAIYLVGKYRLIDVEDALIEQLRVERVPNIKVLIGLALFRMNSEKGMNELQAISVKDSDAKVRRISQAIYNEYFVSNSDKTATAQ